MKPGWSVGIALLAAGCGGGNADNPAATPSAAEPMPRAGVPTTLPAGEGIPGVSVPPPSGRPAPGVDPSMLEAGGDRAAATLRYYFAALQSGRFADAYRLWGDNGRASGMDAAAFADSFARYADYRATIGTPGRIDAGAGQRYIDIPVRVTGHLRDGTPVVLEGPVTLHRTADIDGATAEQRSWRISASGLKPRPAG